MNRYVYGLEIDEPVRLTRMGVHRYYHQAALGTVTELTGWLGHVRERYEYDVYGQPTLRNNVGTEIPASQFGNRFLFQGRDRDPDTGLYNFRYRTYSPTLGRFLQVDPIRERGGLNLYAFVKNDPGNGRDPNGQAGYWSCVGKILTCEALSLTCAGVVGLGVVACTRLAKQGGWENFLKCIACFGAALGACDKMVDCWKDAKAQGCLPEPPDIPSNWTPEPPY